MDTETIAVGGRGQGNDGDSRQAVEQPLRTDQSYHSHHPSGVDSRQGAEYTNDSAKVHTHVSTLARH